MSIRFGSVCSGIEAASVAWHPIGWQAAWFSEIEPFPCEVLKHYYPDIPNFGDMTTLPKRILSSEVEAPDLFCGGTPCQAFSVAGLRQSLADERGNLSLTFCEIANAIDSIRLVRGQPPVIVFWENVPGVLSTADNAFGCFLGALSGMSCPLDAPDDGWTSAGCVSGPERTVAWRVLDAQYFGVAQRRRRVFVVASARADFDPAAVLFEFDGVRRDTAPSKEAGQEVAGTIAARFGISRNNHEECVAAGAQYLGNAEGGAQEVPFLTCHNTGGTAGISNQTPLIADVCHTLRTGGNRTGGDRPPSTDVDTADSLIPVTAQCLTTGTGQRYDPETETILPHPISIHPHCIGRAPESGPQGKESAMQVRRLTPVECERLQGFPDGYTNIPWRKKSESPDGPRYKALGNSWAVPVVRWIGERIDRALD
jgi:DNA (cytosine-5)-methyltransferase 1